MPTSIRPTPPLEDAGMTPLASRLPPELLHLIIQEADSSPALAAWCGVSSGTLPIAGRLLWGEITISRQEQYAQFRTPEASDDERSCRVSQALSFDNTRYLKLEVFPSCDVLVTALYLKLSRRRHASALPPPLAEETGGLGGNSPATPSLSSRQLLAAPPLEPPPPTGPILSTPIYEIAPDDDSKRHLAALFSRLRPRAWIFPDSRRLALIEGPIWSRFLVSGFPEPTETPFCSHAVAYLNLAFLRLHLDHSTETIELQSEYARLCARLLDMRDDVMRLRGEPGEHAFRTRWHECSKLTDREKVWGAVRYPRGEQLTKISQLLAELEVEREALATRWKKEVFEMGIEPGAEDVSDEDEDDDEEEEGELGEDNGVMEEAAPPTTLAVEVEADSLRGEGVGSNGGRERRRPSRGKGRGIRPSLRTAVRDP